jgi:hypothetical protein
MGGSSTLARERVRRPIRVFQVSFIRATLDSVNDLPRAEPPGEEVANS